MAEPWVKFYTSDWLAGTSGLSAAERGVFITLVCLIYEYEGPIPLDYTRLARRCGVPAGSFKRILAALIDQNKVYPTPLGLTNDTCIRMLEERKNRVTKLQSGARKTNAIRAKKNQQKQREAERYPLRSAVREPEPEPESISPCGDIVSEAKAKTEHFEDKKTDQRPKARVEDFQEFWDTYPHRGRKQNRAGSLRKWTALVHSGIPPAEILAGAARYQSDEKVQSGFARLPLTWLNQNGWEDEPAPVSLPNQSLPSQRRSPGHEHLDAAMRAADRFEQEQAAKRALAGGTNPNAAVALFPTRPARRND